MCKSQKLETKRKTLKIFNDFFFPNKIPVKKKTIVFVPLILCFMFVLTFTTKNKTTKFQQIKTLLEEDDDDENNFIA